MVSQALILERKGVYYSEVCVHPSKYIYKRIELIELLKTVFLDIEIS